jgi:phospholipid/cholesterol/gamma-HCH transport system permease protein
MLKVIEKLGDDVLYYLEQTGRMVRYLLACTISSLKPPYKPGAVIRQIHFVGARSMPVILFTGLFTGMVLGLQGVYTLRKFGSEGFIGSAVALSLLRELGPVVAALMVVGRAGSAMTAEVGIMRNSEQIDALDCMAIDPYQFLLAPKFIATVVSVPLLTFVFDIVGIIGGYLIGVSLLGVSAGTYFEGMYAGVVWADVHMGIVKSFVFGLLIVWVATERRRPLVGIHPRLGLHHQRPASVRWKR